VIDPWREESKDKSKRNTEKLARKTPKKRNAERILSAFAANSHVINLPIGIGK
jgi:hypothetical protein